MYSQGRVQEENRGIALTTIIATIGKGVFSCASTARKFCAPDPTCKLVEVTAGRSVGCSGTNVRTSSVFDYTNGCTEK